MTKKDMEQLIDGRVAELKMAVEKEYEPQFKVITDKYLAKRKEFVDVISNEHEDIYGIPFKMNEDDYYIRQIVPKADDSDEYVVLRREANAKKTIIDREADDLKKRLCIMGLKNKEVALILMKYIGMEA